jgi:hypothetical protein
MSNENHILLVEETEIVSESESGLVRSQSRRTKVKKKVQRSSKAGDSKSEKMRGHLKIVKIVLFTIYGLFVYKSISELNNDFMYRSLFYGAFSLAWLLILSKSKWNGRLIVSVSNIWLSCQLIVFMLHFILVIYLQDDLTLF